MRRFLVRSLAASRRQAPPLVRAAGPGPRSVVARAPARVAPPQWFSSAAATSGGDDAGAQGQEGAPIRQAADPTSALSHFEGTRPEWIVVDGKVISRRQFQMEPLNDGDEPSDLEVSWHPSQAVLDESFYSQHDKNRLSVRRAMEVFQEGFDADTGRSEVQGEGCGRGDRWSWLEKRKGKKGGSLASLRRLTPPHPPPPHPIPPQPMNFPFTTIVAALTARINYLTPHFQKHRKDKSGLRGLQRIISQRTKLLKYIRRDSVERYEECIRALGIRDQLSSPPSKYLKTQGWNSPAHTISKRKRRFKKKKTPMVTKAKLGN